MFHSEIDSKIDDTEEYRYDDEIGEKTDRIYIHHMKKKWNYITILYCTRIFAREHGTHSYRICNFDSERSWEMIPVNR